MKNYKLLITDMDGTALPLGGYKKDLLKKDVDFAKKLKEKGKILSVATGRFAHSTLFDITRELGVDCPIVIEGGTRVVDSVTFETLWEKHLPHDAAQEILDIFVRLAGDAGHVLHEKHTWEQSRANKISAKDTVVGKPRFLYLEQLSEELAYSISNAISETDLDVVAHAPRASDGHAVHVVHKHGTKEHGIQELMKMLGVSKEQTIGMGDSSNDVPLIIGTGLGVAVGDASDEIKDIADYIAPNQSEGALAHVIEKFLL